MNKKYLLSSVMAGISLFYANHGTAQCLTKQDCTALGYTETSCPNGGIKCPFGNTWSCTPPCNPAYKYTCSGTGYAGGTGSACDGKYIECSCVNNYNWINGTCCPSDYQYTCSGTGYADGAGTACGGKYTKCTCANGYSWSSGKCTKDSGCTSYETCTLTRCQQGSGTVYGRVTYNCPSGYVFDNRVPGPVNCSPTMSRCL